MPALLPAFALRLAFALSVLVLVLPVLGLACAEEAPSPAAPSADAVQAAKQRLARAVDLPTPKARAAAARALADDDHVSLATWLAACEGFGDFEPVAKRLHEQRIPLLLEGRPIPTLITTYVPSAYDPAVRTPLLMAFHGTSGDGRYDARMWQEVAETVGMVIVSPHEPAAAKGYTGALGEREAAWAALRWARRFFHVDEQRIFATGISRGAHLIWEMALRRPDVFAGIVPLVGCPRISLGAGANTMRFSDNLLHVSIRDLQGARDDPIMVENLRLLFDRLEAGDALDAVYHEFPELGHAWDLRVEDWPAYFGSRKRVPVPERVVRRSVLGGETRSHHVEIQRVDPKAKAEFAIKVKQRTWAKLDEPGKRLFLQAEADRRTARLEVTRTRPGAYRATRHLLRGVYLYVSADMLSPSGTCELRAGAKTARITSNTPPSKQVLLSDFVERFDRGFLPQWRLSLR